VPAIDVPASALHAVLDMLARHVPDREVRVMGSRVSGRAKPFSDLDLVVMGQEPLDLRTLGQLRDAFDESNLPFAVDIVEWASSSHAFRRIIDEQAQPLRPGGAAEDQHWNRLLLGLRPASP
jgi:type I restriction enzyme S subunit